MLNVRLTCAIRIFPTTNPPHTNHRYGEYFSYDERERSQAGTLLSTASSGDSCLGHTSSSRPNPMRFHLNRIAIGRAPQAYQPSTRSAQTKLPLYHLRS